MLAQRSLGASVCLRCRLNQARMLRLGRAPIVPFAAAATTTTTTTTTTTAYAATFTTFARRLQATDEPVDLAEGTQPEPEAAQPAPSREHDDSNPFAPSREHGDSDPFAPSREHGDSDQPALSIRTVADRSRESRLRRLTPDERKVAFGPPGEKLEGGTLRERRIAGTGGVRIGRRGQRIKQMSAPLQREYLGQKSEVLILRDITALPQRKPDDDVDAAAPVDEQDEAAMRRHEIRTRLEASIAGHLGVAGQEEVNEQLNQRRPLSPEGPHYPAFITRQQLKDLRKALANAYNVGQLRRYALVQEDLGQLQELKLEEHPERGVLWKSAFQEGVSPIEKRLPDQVNTAAPLEKMPKMQVVDRIVRRLWEVGVIEESEAVGEMEIKLEPWQFDILNYVKRGGFTILDNIGSQRQVRVESYRPESVLRFVAERENAEQAVTDIQRVLRRFQIREFNLEDFESLRQKRGLERLQDFFTPKDLELTVKLSNTILDTSQHSKVVIYGMDIDTVFLARRILLNMIDLPTAAESRIVADAEGEGFMQSCATESALHYKHRKKNLARWTFPVQRDPVRRGKKSQAQKEEPASTVPKDASNTLAGAQSLQQEPASTAPEVVDILAEAPNLEQEIASTAPEDVTDTSAGEPALEEAPVPTPLENATDTGAKEQASDEAPASTTPEDVTDASAGEQALKQEPASATPEVVTDTSAGAQSLEEAPASTTPEEATDTLAGARPDHPPGDTAQETEAADGQSPLTRKVTNFFTAPLGSKKDSQWSESEKTKFTRGTYWGASSLIEFYATFGNILHKPSTNDSLAPVSLSKLLEHSEDPSRIFLHRVPGFSPYLQHLASYAKLARHATEEKTPDALLFRFVPSPVDLEDTSSLEDFPDMGLRVELSRTTGRARFQGLGLTIRERNMDVLMPEKPVDVRFTQRQVLWTRDVLRRSESVKDYLLNVSTNISGGGAIRAPAMLKLRIPAWTVTNSDKYSHLPTHQTEHGKEYVKQFLFSAVEHRQMFKYDLPGGKHRVTYTSVEAGRLGGRRGELRLRLKKPSPSEEKMREQIPGTVEEAFDMASLIDDAVHDRLRGHELPVRKIELHAPFKRVTPDGRVEHPMPSKQARESIGGNTVEKAASVGGETNAHAEDFNAPLKPGAN